MNEKEIEEYLEKHEFNIQNVLASYFIIHHAIKSYVGLDLIKGVNFFPFSGHFDFIKRPDNPFTQIVAEEKINQNTKKLYDQYCKDSKILDRLIKEQGNYTRELRKIWEEFNERKNYSKKELSDFFKRATDVSSKLWKYFAILEDKGEVVNLVIIPAFAKRNNIKLNEAKEIVSALSHPDETTAFARERIQFLNICLNLESKKIDDLIVGYQKNFFWFKSDYYKTKKVTKDMIIKDALKEIKEKKIKGIKAEINKMESGLRKIKLEKSKALKNFKLKPRDKKDIYFADRVIFWVDKRKIWMMEDIYFLHDFIRVISKKTSTPYDDITFYLRDEILALLKKGRKLGRGEIKKRKFNLFCYYNKNKPPKIYYGKIAERMFNLSQKHDLNNIAGTVASKGKNKKVIGEVKIINKPEKESFQKGQILVTSMTRVEFVPLMRVAKAIVTDEGGMACHAAIVSRELGVPALIGTKVATKALKDGDRVELDMETGKIKIIK